MTTSLKTVDQLRAHMQQVSGEDVDDARLFWFVCIFNAQVISSTYSSKDIAHMLLGGVEAIDSLQDVQEFLDTFYEDADDEEAEAEAYESLDGAVCDFFGVDDEDED